MSSNLVHEEVYSMQHYVIQFVSDLRQIGGFLRVLRCPPPIKLTATIWLKYWSLYGCELWTNSTTHNTTSLRKMQDCALKRIQDLRKLKRSDYSVFRLKLIGWFGYSLSIFHIWQYRNCKMNLCLCSLCKFIYNFNTNGYVLIILPRRKMRMSVFGANHVSYNLTDDL
jgi:hypothetical protein